MQHQKPKKKIKRKSKQKPKSSWRAEFRGYQADNPLTKYFEKIILKNRDQIGLLTNWMVLLFTRFFEISDNLTVGPWTIRTSLEFKVINVDLK